MYIRLSTKRSKGKIYQYLQLCEAYRNQKGQACTRVVGNFGRIDQLNRKKIDSAINALLGYASNPSITRLSDLEHGRVRDYGDILTLVHLWSRLRLSESIARHLKESKVGFDVAQMVKVMVLNRVSDPLSKLGVMRWLATVYIPELHGEDVEYHHLLRAMDYLISIKDEIEKDLYNQLITLFSPDVDLVFYDLTSSYFEGDGPELAEYGYSRDSRPDRKQIVLALVTTREGLPIYHEVLAGNTADVTTLGQTVEVLRSRFQIRKTVFVCDRGLISQENLDKLDEMGFPYIISLRPRNNEEAQTLYQKTLFGFESDSSLNGLLIKEARRGKIRYIQCHNPEVAKEKKKGREQRYTKIQAEIKRLEKRFQRGQLTEHELYHRVFEVLEDKRMATYFDPKIEQGRLILYIRPEVWERETYLDGKFFLKTNLSSDELDAPEVVRSYKQLQEVERAFRELKDFLKIRPIFHYTDSRVRAHIFICVLAYLLEKLVELNCQRASLPYSARRALSLLSQLKAIECHLNGQTITMTNRVNDQIHQIFDALGVPRPPKILQT
jgi:transposase